MKRFCKFVSDYMGVLVLLSALAALLFPGTIGHLKPRLINPLLGVIMFGMGLTLKAEDFKVVFSRPKDVLVPSASSSSDAARAGRPRTSSPTWPRATWRCPSA